MSPSHEHDSDSFLERWWQPLVIFIGIGFALLVAHWKPGV